MSLKRKSTAFDESLIENKKLRSSNNNLSRLSYFECLPDHILVEICDKLKTSDLRNLFLISKTVVRRISSLKSVSRRFRIDLNKVDDFRINLCDKFKGVFIDGLNLKVELRKTFGRKTKNLGYEKTIQFYPNAESLKLIRKPLDRHFDNSLNMLINLRRLDFSGIVWRKYYSRTLWNLPNLEHLNIISSNHATISLIFSKLEFSQNLTSLSIKSIRTPWKTLDKVKSGRSAMTDFLLSHKKIVKLSLSGYYSDYVFIIDKELSLKSLKFDNYPNMMLVKNCKKTLMEFSAIIFDLEAIQFLMSDCPNLKIMSIKLQKNCFSRKSSVELKNNSSIEVLEVQQENSTVSWINAFDIVQKCQNLKRFTLNNCYGDRDFPQNLSPVPSLQFLSFKFEFPTDSHWRKIMTIFPNITELEIQLGRITYKSLPVDGFLEAERVNFHDINNYFILIPNYDIFEIFGEGFYKLKKLKIMVFHRGVHRNFCYNISSLIKMIKTHQNLKHVEIPGTEANEDQIRILKEKLITFKTSFTELKVCKHVFPLP